MHEIIFDLNVIDFLEKLPKETRLRIFNKILSTKSNPFRYFERLKSGKDYKLRIWDYRICADIDNQTIIITLIGHRKNIKKISN